jgi:hypothetical protein
MYVESRLVCLDSSERGSLKDSIDDRLAQTNVLIFLGTPCGLKEHQYALITRHEGNCDCYYRERILSAAYTHTITPGLMISELKIDLRQLKVPTHSTQNCLDRASC